jgi:hypothetical protein
MVDDASSSSRAHGRRRRNIWLQRELRGRGQELELSISMVVGSWPAQAQHGRGAGAREETTGAFGASLWPASCARSTLGAASSMASGSRWVSMRMAARSADPVSHLMRTGAPRRSGDAPGDDGGVVWPGLGNEKRWWRWEVGVARGRAVRDGLTWAGWRPVRLASFELTLGSDMNGRDKSIRATAEDLVPAPVMPSRRVPAGPLVLGPA